MSDQQPEKQLLIKQSAAQAILDYLAKKAYVEVHQLAPLLMNLKEGVEKEWNNVVQAVENEVKKAE